MASTFDKPPTAPAICENDPVNNLRPAIATMATGEVRGSDSVGGGHTVLDALSNGQHSSSVHKQIVAK